MNRLISTLILIISTTAQGEPWELIETNQSVYYINSNTGTIYQLTKDKTGQQKLTEIHRPKSAHENKKRYGDFTDLVPKQKN